MKHLSSIPMIYFNFKKLCSFCFIYSCLFLSLHASFQDTGKSYLSIVIQKLAFWQNQPSPVEDQYDIVYLPENKESRLHSVYNYDDQGLLETKLLFDENGLLLSTTTFSYDSFNRLIKEMDEMGTGIEREYDGYSRPLIETFFETGNFLQQVHYRYEEAQGRLSSIETMDQDGKNNTQTFTYEESVETTHTLGWGDWFKEKLNSIFHNLHEFKEKASYTRYMEEEWNQRAEQIFNKGYLQFSGFYSEEVDSGCTPYGKEINDHVRVTLVNGILNAHSDLDMLLKIFSESHGGIPIHYVYRHTEGWTRDLLTSTLSKLGFVSPCVTLLAEMWKDMIEEMGGIKNGGKIIHYAHSIGAADTYVAKNLMTPEEQQMIHVITFGSPTMIPNKSGFGSAINYVSRRDGVCLLDPIGLSMGHLYGTSRIELVGSYWGIPLIDHTLYTDSYGLLIRELGAKFIETHEL